MSRFLLSALAVLALAFAGCTNPARPIVEAQTPGHASGAGATLTGPGNSATPSTQEAERVTEYFEPVTPAAHDSAGASHVTHQAPPAAVVSRDVPRLASDRADTPRPRYVRETVKTTIGQHQDAAPLIRAAAYASNWSGPKWIGLLCIFVGSVGWLYGVTHRETGYPLVFLKVAGCGVLLVLVGDNPLWLLVLGLPLAFYAAQKLGVLRPLP